MMGGDGNRIKNMDLKVYESNIIDFDVRKNQLVVNRSENAKDL